MYTWNRPILKANAKLALQHRYWRGFAVSLVALLLSGTAISFFWSRWYSDAMIYIWGTMRRLARPSYGSYSFYPRHHSYGYGYGYGSFGGGYTYLQNDLLNTFLSQLLRYVAVAGVLTIVLLLVRIFLGSVMQVGQARYYVHSRFGDSRFGIVFSGFRDCYLNVVGAKFTTGLIIWLWSLLLVVPGIVASYRYYYVNFLLADNPGLTGSRARAISRLMTQGEKGRLFVFDLSFLGWMLLAGIVNAFTFGTGGSALLAPYYMAARAELYIFARDRAIQAGFLHPAELNLAAA